MTATIGGSSGNHRRSARLQAAADWIGHHWMAFLLMCLAAGPFLDLLPRQWKDVSSPTFLAVLLPALLLGQRHDARLCERCAAQMPLDGDAAAARYGRRLHLVHIPVLWFASIVVMLPVSFLLHGWAAFAGELAVTPLAMYAWISSRTHRQLYPWCPRCNWGNGGDGITEPSPDPSIDAPSPQMA